MSLDVGASVGPFVDSIPDLPGRFDFVELAIGEGELPVDDLDVEGVRSALSTADLDLTVHLPFRQPLATSVDRIDRANRAYLSNLLAVCGDLDARRAVVHVHGRRYGSDPETFARERLRPVMEEVAATGREEGVEVCFENVGNVGGTPLELVGDVAVEADLPLCFDVGHAFSERDQDAVEAFAREYADRIAHLHVHDVRRRGDNHISIGTGEVDFEGVARALGPFDGTATVEVFTDDPDHLELSAEKFLTAVDRAVD